MSDLKRFERFLAKRLPKCPCRAEISQIRTNRSKLNKNNVRFGRICKISRGATPNHLGFQESGQEAGAAGTDCRNLHFHRPCRSPFFWNPVPLMQNYMIKSVKMTKKSILRDQFSWKVRTFADVFSQRHYFILLNYPVELLPRKGLNEQTYTSLKLRTKRRLHHRCIGAVAGLTGYMGRGLRFLYAFELVLSPQI